MRRACVNICAAITPIGFAMTTSAFLSPLQFVPRIGQGLVRALCMFCMFFSSVAWVAAAEPITTSGAVVAIGGALRADNAAVWERLVSLSGGKSAKWLIIPTASGDPAAAARQTIQTFAKYGATAEMIPLSPAIKDAKVADVVRSAQWIQKIDAAGGIYFTGGSQARITDALAPDGVATPLLDAIWRLNRRGGVIAGTSAGAAVVSALMFREPESVLTIMRQGAEAGRDIGRGLGFVRADTFVDQHFLKRGRIGRMLAVMAQQNLARGVGVEEDSAAVFLGTTVESIGAKGVLVADLSGVTEREVKPLAIKGAVLTWLASGDRFDLATGRVELSAQKRAGKRLDATAPDFKPYYNAVRFYPDFLSEGTLLSAMAELVDSSATETRGIAFEPTGGTKQPSKATDVGFEFRLYKTPNTIGYLASTKGDDDYTIERMSLDIVPVVMAKPLYRPISPAVATGANVRSEAAGGAKAGENGGFGRQNLPTPENLK